MPPIENKFSNYSKWIQTLNRPVYGIDYVKKMIKFDNLNKVWFKTIANDSKRENL